MIIMPIFVFSAIFVDKTFFSFHQPSFAILGDLCGFLPVVALAKSGALKKNSNCRH